MPKLDPATSAWARFVAGSVRSQADLQRALRRTITLARDEGSDSHLRVLVFGPAASGKSTLLSVVRRLAASTGFPALGLEVFEDEIGSPSAHRVAWQVVQGDGDAELQGVRRQLRRSLDQRDGPRAQLVHILTKEPHERTAEIASEIDLIDVLTWATETV